MLDFFELANPINLSRLYVLLSILKNRVCGEDLSCVRNGSVHIHDFEGL